MPIPSEECSRHLETLHLWGMDMFRLDELSHVCIVTVDEVALGMVQTISCPSSPHLLREGGEGGGQQCQCQ